MLYLLLKWRKLRLFIEQLFPTMFKGEKNIVIEINYVKKIIIGGIDDARNMCLRSI